MKTSIVAFFVLTLLVDNSVDQENGFKSYTNAKYKFSVDIPASWVIVDESDEPSIGTCMPTNPSEIESYKDCFEGIIFRLMGYEKNLDKTLLDDGLYTKFGNNYYTTDRVRDSVMTENIKGKNWKGIYHNNVCGISCEETGFHAAAGQCEFFYFSNGTRTICITTNGRQFDDYVRAQLLKTFKFN
jgi:hypothetical protein